MSCICEQTLWMHIIYCSFCGDAKSEWFSSPYFVIPNSPSLYLHSPNVWFSSAYILFGAAIIVVMLTVAGNEVEEKASMAMYKSLQRRENYEKKMSRENPLHIRTKAFLSYNAAYLIVIIAWLLWLVFIIVWAMLEVPEWHFPEAQYFAVSLCSSAGSFSLPTTSSDIAYLLAGISMMIGVSRSVYCCYRFIASLKY